MTERFAVGAQASGLITLKGEITRAGSSGDNAKSLIIPPGMISIGDNGRGFVIPEYDSSSPYAFNLPVDLSGDTSYVIIANAPPASVGDGICTISFETFSTYSGDTDSRRAFCYFVTNASFQIIPSTIRTYESSTPNQIWNFLSKAGLYVNKHSSDFSFAHRGQQWDEYVKFANGVATGDIVYLDGDVYKKAIADDTDKEVVVGIAEVDRGNEYSLSGTISTPYGDSGSEIALITNYVHTSGIVDIPNAKLDSTLYPSGTYVYLSEDTAGALVRDFDAFQSSTAYVVGDQIIEAVDDAGTQNGIIYVWEVTTAGTSGSEPTWSTGDLEVTLETSGSVTFKKLAFHSNIPTTSANYPTGTATSDHVFLAQDANGVYYIWTASSGTFGAEPTWPAGDIGTTVADGGGVTWTKSYLYTLKAIGSRKIRVGVSLGGDGTNTRLLVNGGASATSVDDHDESAVAHQDIQNALEKAGIYVVNPEQGKSVANVRFKGQHFDEQATFSSGSDYDIVYKTTGTPHQYGPALSGAGSNQEHPIGIRLPGGIVACGSGFVDYDTSSGGPSGALSTGAQLYLSNSSAGKLTTTVASDTKFVGWVVTGGATLSASVPGCIYIMLSNEDNTTPIGQLVSLETAVTNVVQYPLRIEHTTTATPANNIGVGLEFCQETSISNNEVLGTIEVYASDTTATSEDGVMTFNLMTAGALATEKFRVTSLGNFTIGGTGYTNRLNVIGGNGTIYLEDSLGRGAVYLLANDTVGNIQFRGTPDGGANYYFASVNMVFTGGGNESELAFYTQPTLAGTTDQSVERMRIDKDGNVAIGGTNPTNRFEVIGGNDTIYLEDSNGRGFIKFVATNPGGYFQFRGTPDAGSNYYFANIKMEYPGSGNASDLTFYTQPAVGGTTDQSVERMRIDKDGKIGVGTSTNLSNLSLSDGTDQFQFTITTNQLAITSYTSDTADDQAIKIDAGNGAYDATRGAALIVAGNEHTLDGDIRHLLGETGELIVFYGSSSTQGLTLTSTGYFGIRGTAPDRLLTLTGTSSSNTDGAHVSLKNDGDAYPLMYLYNYAHDNISIGFDKYTDNSGTELSSDAGSNFDIYKATDLLSFRYDSGITPGSAVSMNTALAIDVNGQVFIGGTSTDLGGQKLIVESAFGNYSGDQAPQITILSSSAQAADTGGRISLGGKYTDAGGSTIFGDIGAFKTDGNTGNSGGYLVFATRPNGGILTEAMRITSAQKVYIGGGQSINLGAHKLFIYSAYSSYTSDQAPHLAVLANNAMAIDIGGRISMGGEYNSISGATTIFGDIGGFKENSSDNNTAGYLGFATRPDAGTLTEAMRINSTGDLIIGATSEFDTAKVTIKSPYASYAGSGAPNLAIITTDGQAADTGGRISLGGATDNTPTTFTTFGDIGGFKENSTNGETGGYLAFATRSDTNPLTEAMRIDSAQNIAIGVNGSASAKVHIRSASASISGVDSGADELLLEGSGDSGLSIFSGASSKGHIYFGKGSSGSQTAGRINYDHSANSLDFYTNDTLGLTLNSTQLATFVGRIITDDTTEATSTTDGSIQTDGGLSVAKNIISGGIITNNSEMIIQSVSSISNNQTSGTSGIPFDTTIPQASEGELFTSVAFAPLSASSKVRIRFWGHLSYGASARLSISISNNTTGDCLASSTAFTTESNVIVFVGGEFEYSPGTTSSKTYYLRYGENSSGCYINRGSAATYHNGGLTSGFIIEEIL